jgi:hypothetical protein
MSKTTAERTPYPTYLKVDVKFWNSGVENSPFCIRLQRCGCERRFYLLKVTTWYGAQKRENIKKCAGLGYGEGWGVTVPDKWTADCDKRGAAWCHTAN